MNETASPVSAKRLSIFKETCQACLDNFRACFFFLVVYCLLSTAVDLYGAQCSAQFFTQKNIHFQSLWNTAESCVQKKGTDYILCVKEAKKTYQKPEALAKAEIKENLPNIIIAIVVITFLRLLIMSGAVYICLATYLKKNFKSAPDYAFNKYLRSTLDGMWAVSRPILWNLIPVLGQIMYARSVLHYHPVSALAIMGEERPLATSWKLAHGNIWRLAGAFFLICFLFMIIALPFVIMARMISFLPLENTIAVLMPLLAQSLWVYVLSMYIGSAYKTLLQEYESKGKA